jgi:FkbM family methyltransferase
LSANRVFLRRALAFVKKPIREQLHIVVHNSRRVVRRMFKRTINMVLPSVALPMRIEGGARWLASNDWVGDSIYENVFELYERQFVWEFLKPGMAMLDVGAHHGLYTVIAATRVGNSGRVVAFEPSPRERARLEAHIRLNELSQVSVEAIALGREQSRATLYLPTKKNSGYNTLRVPEFLKAEVTPVEVPIVKLDDYLAAAPERHLDLIKIDVEGAERDVLLGGEEVLSKAPLRPLLLCEVEDERTSPWGYRALEIIEMTEAWGYSWFLPLSGGRLTPFDSRPERFAHNLVAIPPERRQELEALIVER